MLRRRHSRSIAVSPCARDAASELVRRRHPYVTPQEGIGWTSPRLASLLIAIHQKPGPCLAHAPRQQVRDDDFAPFLQRLQIGNGLKLEWLVDLRVAEHDGHPHAIK